MKFSAHFPGACRPEDAVSVPPRRVRTRREPHAVEAPGEAAHAAVGPCVDAGAGEPDTTAEITTQSDLFRTTTPFVANLSPLEPAP